jgi:hypothetical protein
MELNIQKAVYDTLKNSAVLLAKVTGVYDNVPQETKYPYVTIGDDTGIEYDTDDSTGIEATITVHIWSRKSGRKEIKKIMKIIYDVLHRTTLIISGYECIGCDWEFSETFLDPDGQTKHGVTRFRILAEEE